VWALIKPFKWLMLNSSKMNFLQVSLIFTLAQMESVCSKILLLLTLMRSLQMEATELQSNDSLKDAFSEGNLLQFYAGLPILNLLTIKRLLQKKIEFGSIYICEQAFLVMDYQKINIVPSLLKNTCNTVTNFIFQFRSRYPQINWRHPTSEKSRS
jgi:hypothetical protein